VTFLPANFASGLSLRLGAYRHNEVDATHPLMHKFQAIRNAGAKIDEITLAPLAREHIEKLIADALDCESERAAPLAQLVHEKTAGNPFFVEPHGQSPCHLTNAQAGRHPGQELAHSSTGKGRGFLLPG